MEFQAVLDAVRSLPVDDQERLVEQIKDDLLAQGVDAGLSVEQQQELDRRLTDMDADPDDGVSWQAVFAESRARHQR